MSTTYPATVTITDLPLGTTLTGAELLEAVQTTSGVGKSVQISASQIATLAGGGTGSVTSVAMTVPTGLTVIGSPISTTGTLAVSWSGTIPVPQIPLFSAVANGGVPASAGGTSTYLRADGTWNTPSGAGSVTSVAMTVPTGLSVGGSPISTAGTLALSWSGTIPNAQIPLFTSIATGGVPPSGGGTVNFMRADGAWAPPPGGGGGGSAAFTYENANFGASSNNGYAVDTSGGAITVTLPAAPAAGAWVQLMDYAGAWGASNVTVNRNGLNINSAASNLTLNVPNSMVMLVYGTVAIGWKVVTL